MLVHANAKLGLAGRLALVSRIEEGRSQPSNRYEWPCPGDLLHVDVSRYARFERPRHAVTGDRSQRSRTWMRPETRVGYDYAHAIVDDHSRLAYAELRDDEKAETVTGFVERACKSRPGLSPFTAVTRVRIPLGVPPEKPAKRLFSRA